MREMTPLEIARKREADKAEKRLYSCHECKKCVKVGGWWYCEHSGKMLHPFMLERISPFHCVHADVKEKKEDA